MVTTQELQAKGYELSQRIKKIANLAGVSACDTYVAVNDLEGDACVIVKVYGRATMPSAITHEVRRQGWHDFGERSRTASYVVANFYMRPAMRLDRPPKINLDALK